MVRIVNPRNPILGWLFAAWLLGAATPTLAGGGMPPRVDDLRATLAEDRSRATVGFRVEGGVTEDSLERIHSGIEVTLKYRLRMMADRAFPMLPWDEVARTRIQVAVTYDSLTGVYSLSRTLDVKARKKKDKPPEVVESRETNSVDEMRRWMTDFEDVALYDPAQSFPDKPLRVKLESDLGRRYVWLVFPGTLGASAELDLVK